MAKKSTTKPDAIETGCLPSVEVPSTATASKKAQLIGMLHRPAGSTIVEISAALGWQAHTTRAAITGLRKSGHAVKTARPADGGAGLTYRIVSKPQGEPDRAPGTEA
ncbi:MAG: DUF3489 domain-containing protein [Rhodobacterales bacterium]|nr:DUF3489 domain-containing protein [Rhodobacterales bacterium]